MGNFSSKDGHGQPATAPHLDVFHTAPNSPVSDAPSLPQPASAVDFTASSGPVPFGTKSHHGPTSTPTPSPTQQAPPTTPVPISPNNATVCPLTTPPVQKRPGSVASPKKPGALGRNGCPSTSTPTPRTHLSQPKSLAASPTKTPSSPSTVSSTTSPSESSWKDGDSGLCPSPPQANGARGIQGEEMERLLEEYRATLGVGSGQDDALSTTELLRGVLTEVTTLRSTIQAERGEWQQFQSDLQVAVAVADRLRAEAEEELAALRAAHRDLERELSTAQRRQREADGQLAALRDELKESRQKGHNAGALTRQMPQCKAEAPQAQNRDSRSGNNNNNGPAIEISNCADEQEEGGGTQQQERGRERGTYRAGRDGTAARGSQSQAAKNSVKEEGKMDSKGVANRYLRTLTNEERRGEEGQANETRRTVATERSRSLSRLPVSSDTSPAVQNGISQSNTSISAGSTNKNAGQPKSRRSLDPQDSWSSSTHIGKREELLNKYNSALTEVPPSKSQDGFNLLLRRHGGSKRNSLLRWCQNRTQGYKNIDITNFSSSWADGLAFCAVYHTYLPSHIPYCTLSPESKQENLSLAFKTGENVGIAQSLTMEEMLRAGGPDWQRVLSYVESMYRHFEM